MAKAKFDYNGDEFYMEIMALAMKGLTDSQIAFSLEEKFGETLTEGVFNTMKNGKYDKWTEEENTIRGNRIAKALAHGREKINSIVRGSYLKAALGGKKTRDVAITTRKMRRSDGEESGEIELTRTETERELPPNMQALATWLFNHDEEWKKAVIEGKKLDITSKGEKVEQVTVFELPDNGRSKDK